MIRPEEWWEMEQRRIGSADWIQDICHRHSFASAMEQVEREKKSLHRSRDSWEFRIVHKILLSEPIAESPNVGAHTELDALLSRVREDKSDPTGKNRNAVAYDCWRMFEGLAERFKEEFAMRDFYKARSDAWRDQALGLCPPAAPERECASDE